MKNLFYSVLTASRCRRRQNDKPGDVNQDGVVDISDIVKVINIIAEGEDE
ncbi:MAG: hypothetical protein IJ607_02095 [Bacteroidaceae bacterium]|nr:hypothetical protein [Bacteroidaceae bacterium]